MPPDWYGHDVSAFLALVFAAPFLVAALTDRIGLI